MTLTYSALATRWGKSSSFTCRWTASGRSCCSASTGCRPAVPCRPRCRACSRRHATWPRFSGAQPAPRSDRNTTTVTSRGGDTQVRSTQATGPGIHHKRQTTRRTRPSEYRSTTRTQPSSTVSQLSHELPMNTRPHAGINGHVNHNPPSPVLDDRRAGRARSQRPPPACTLSAEFHAMALARQPAEGVDHGSAPDLW